MSLINDALKKAQRQRSETPFVAPPMPGGGGRIAKRGAPMRAQTIALIVVGCVVLIVLSVGGTIFLVRDKPSAEKSPAVVASAPKTEPAPKASEPAPAVVVPVIVPPIITPPPLVPPAPIESKSEAKPIAVAPVVAPAPTSNPSTSQEPRPAGPSEPSPRPAQQDERIHAFLDALKVTGIRSSGTGSRVLMNGYVYRIGDVVDRTLALKLTDVQADSLTFVDRNGTSYVKNF